MYHINRQRTARIKEALLKAFKREGEFADIECDGLSFSFRGKKDVTVRSVPTGVEHAGGKEAYLERTVLVDGLSCTGSYGPSGDPVPTDLDLRSLTGELEEDGIRVVIHPPALPPKPAVTYIPAPARIGHRTRRRAARLPFRAARTA